MTVRQKEKYCYMYKLHDYHLIVWLSDRKSIRDCQEYSDYSIRVKNVSILLSQITQNVRLSKSLQMCCHQDNFMVVIQKVVKVVSNDNQNVLTMTNPWSSFWHPESCHDDNLFGLSGRRNRHRQIDNLKVHIVVNLTPFWTPFDNLTFCVMDDNRGYFGQFKVYTRGCYHWLLGCYNAHDYTTTASVCVSSANSN